MVTAGGAPLVGTGAVRVGGAAEGAGSPPDAAEAGTAGAGAGEGTAGTVGWGWLAGVIGSTGAVAMIGGAAPITAGRGGPSGMERSPSVPLGRGLRMSPPASGRADWARSASSRLVRFWRWPGVGRTGRSGTLPRFG